MTTVLLVIHLMVAAALVAVVLLQRSEGGALGIGGGGFMSGRGAANLLTRATGVLAAIFFATSILLTVMARHGGAPSLFKDVKGLEQTQTPAAPAPGSTPASGEGEKKSDGATAPQPAGSAPAAPTAHLSK
jgi:preprotein translocase subunit SecG